MDRTVADVTIFAPITLMPIGDKATHYTTPWVDGMEGETIRLALIAAFVPDSVLVTHDTAAFVLDVALPFDDDGDYAAVIASTVGV